MITPDIAMTTAPAQAADADLVGRWEGALNVGGASLPIVIRVEQGPDGLATVMDSPAQNVRGLAVTGLSDAGGVVRFSVPAARVISVKVKSPLPFSNSSYFTPSVLPLKAP